MERLPATNPDVLGIPDAVLVRPTLIAVFDHVRDALTLCAPVWPDARPVTRAPPGRRRRPGWTRRRRRWTARCPARRRAGRAARAAGARLQLHPRGLHRGGGAAKEYIRAGDCLPDRAVASASRCPSPCRPSRSTGRCGGSTRRPSCSIFDFGGFAAVGASPEILVRLRDGMVTVRPLAGTRRRGATPEEDQRAGGRAAGRPEGARRAPDAARPRPQRRRPRRGDRQREGDGAVPDRALQPGHAHRQRGAGPAAAGARRRSTRWWPASRPARCPARPRCGRWRSSRSWSPRGAASMPAASAISAPMAAWTPASGCAPRW